MTNHYIILGIPKNASQEEIRKAFRKLSAKFHPDINGGDKYFSNMFIQVRQAYEILSDPASKAKYDLDLFESEKKGTNKQRTENSNFEPVIELFTCNTECFYSGDEIEIKWSCFNADKVTISPLGEQEITGTRKYKINNYNKEALFLDLTVYNTSISKSKTSRIMLINKLYKDIYNEKVQFMQKEEKEIASKYKWYNEEWIVYLLMVYSFLFFYVSFLFFPFVFYALYKNSFFDKDKKINLYIVASLACVANIILLMYSFPEYFQY